MKKKFVMILLTAMIAIFAAACGSNTAAPSQAGTEAPKTEAPKTDAAQGSAAQEELSIKHQLGETKVKKNPKNVVVFDYSVLETLDKLGVEVAAVPQESLPPHLSKYKDAKYTNAGTLFEPDFEKLSALKPELIIISGRAAEKYEELNKLAPTVHLGVDTKKFMESFTENVTTLGKIFGKEAEAEKELAAINDSIAKLKEQATANGKKALIILQNGGKVSAYGPGSRFGILHDVFGVAPVDPTIQVSTHGQSISFEFVAEKNPDVLFVVDRDTVVKGNGAQTSGKDVIENDLVKGTNAYKNGKLIYLDPSFWYISGSGLISVPEMIKEVEAAIK